MSHSSRIPDAITNDDLTVGHAYPLLELKRFHDQYEIPVTYFVILCPLRADRRCLSEDQRMCDDMAEVEAGGSEVAPHAFEH